MKKEIDRLARLVKKASASDGASDSTEQPGSEDAGTGNAAAELVSDASESTVTTGDATQEQPSSGTEKRKTTTRRTTVKKSPVAGNKSRQRATRTKPNT